MLTRPVYALPLDLFRVLVGLVCFAYFAHTLAEVQDISSPEGLVDHELSLGIFWYTRIGLFQPGMGRAVFEAAFLLACLASWMLVLGYRVKPAAAVLYVIAVSTYRWNFLVMYVDDAVMHLMLLWMLLLPVGRTLVLHEWLADGRAALGRWKAQLVPGGAVRCFLANLALIYLTAGAWKWTSPMWRDGTALFAVLKLPISFAPDFWRPEHLTLLRVANYTALVIEPLFPLALVLRTNHPLKWALFLRMLGFHAGIIATLKIPYANLACLAAGAVVFRDELMGAIVGRRGAPPAQPQAARRGWAGAAALALLLLVAVATLGEVMTPPWRAPSRRTAPADGEADRGGDSLDCPCNQMRAPLWAAGLAQSYRLFDWVDDRNFSASYEVLEKEGDVTVRSADPGEFFPGSVRSTLLQSYLHGVTWHSVPAARSDELKRSLYTRFARRYCRNHHPAGRVQVYATVRRITAEGAGPGRRELLLEFDCRDGEPVLHYVRLGQGVGGDEP